MELKVQQIERGLSLLNKNPNQAETENVSFKRHLCQILNSMLLPQKQSSFNLYKKHKKYTQLLPETEARVSTSQILNFLHQTMETLNVYERQLNGQIDTESTHSKMSSAKYKFKLLNKDLNFFPATEMKS